MMLKRVIVGLFIVTTLLLSSCSIYRLDVQQGNIITHPKLKKLKIGMTKQTVVQILGNPVLIDTFDNNHWHYVYTFRKGSGSMRTRRVFLHFVKGRLAKISGFYNLT